MGEPGPGFVPCVGCGGTVPDVDRATHDYIVASPGCWHVYGRWMAERAWSPSIDPVVAAHHVDCYAVQHPDGVERDRRQRQSVAVHLISLCQLVEFEQPAHEATRTRARTGQTVLAALGLDDWPLLDPPERRGATTIAEVAVAGGDAFPAVFERWVHDCWDAWSRHHVVVREWTEVVRRTR